MSNRKVVIIGAGGAGLAAAVAATQTSPQVEVTVLDKNSVQGGITAIATGTIRACDSPLQKLEQRRNETREDARRQYLEAGCQKQDPQMLEAFLARSGDAVAWLIAQGCEIKLHDDFRHLISPWKEGLSGGTGLTETLYTVAQKAGVRFFFNTRANALTVKEGRIAGVKALSQAGQTLDFPAQAVVLADGGFWGADAGAFDKDIPPKLREVIVMAGGNWPQGGAGDGARMAEAAGASLENMDALEYTAQRYLDSNGNLTRMPGSATLWSDAASVILNQDLARFVNEDLCYVKEFLTDAIVDELIKRHEKWYWNVWDQVSRENAYRIRFWIGQGLIEKRVIVTGNTLEELAVNMKNEPAKLAAAINRYNSFFTQRLDKDPDHGRNLKRDKVHPISKPPFFAMRAGVQVNNRRGGIAADTQARALNRARQPIPGLYVAGSSMDAMKFDGMGWLSGTGFTACVVWGRLAGENAALGR